MRRLVHFMAELKSGVPGAGASLFTPAVCDVVPGEYQLFAAPTSSSSKDSTCCRQAVVEPGDRCRCSCRTSSISRSYVDAAENDIEQWYIERFQTLRETVFTNASSYFHRYAALSPAESVETARRLWTSINLVNLRENVLPTRERAHLILEKARSRRAARASAGCDTRPSAVMLAADSLASSGAMSLAVSGREKR